MDKPKRTKDPKVLNNGRCYQCGRERPHGAHFYSDPFCRTDCCKAYYAGEPRKAYKPLKEEPKAAPKKDPVMTVTDELQALIST